MFIIDHQFSAGLILGVETGAQMSIPQMATLGQFAKNEKKYTLTVPWLELTLQNLLEDEKYSSNAEMSNFVRGLLHATMMEVTLL